MSHLCHAHVTHASPARHIFGSWDSVPLRGSVPLNQCSQSHHSHGPFERDFEFFSVFQCFLFFFFLFFRLASLIYSEVLIDYPDYFDCIYKTSPLFTTSDAPQVTRSVPRTMNSSKLSKIKHKLTPSSHSSSSNTQILANNHHHSSSNTNTDANASTSAFNSRSFQDNRTYSVASDALFNDDFGVESSSLSHSSITPAPPLRPVATTATTATTSHNSNNIPIDIPRTPVFVNSSSPVTTNRPDLSFVHKPHDDEFIFLDTPSFRDMNDSASSMSHLGTPRSSNHNVNSIHNTPHESIPTNHSHPATHNNVRDSISSNSDSAGSFEEKPGLLTKLKVYSDDDDDDSSIDENPFSNISSSIHSRSKNLNHSPAPSQSTFAQSKFYRTDHTAHSQYFHNNRIPSDTREEIVTKNSGSKNLFQSFTSSVSHNTANNSTKPLSLAHSHELESSISSADSGSKHTSNKPTLNISSSIESNNSIKSTNNLLVIGPSGAHNGQDHPSSKGSNLTLTLTTSHTESADSGHENNNNKTNFNNFHGHYIAYNKSSGSLISRGSRSRSRSRSINKSKSKSKSKSRPPTPNAPVQIIGQTTPMSNSRPRSRSHTLSTTDPLIISTRNDADSGSAKSIVNRSLANSNSFDFPMPVGRLSQISRSNSSNIVNQSKDDMISLSSGSADAVNSPQTIVNEFSRQISNMNMLTTADYNLITAQENAKEAQVGNKGNVKQINNNDNDDDGGDDDDDDDDDRCNDKVKSTSTLIHFEDYKEYNTIDSYNKLLTNHERQSFAQNHIPKETIMLSKYFLYKIVNSKSRSQQVKHPESNANANSKDDFKIRGEFVTSKLFIPRDIWTLSLLTIRDAKIKQNILNDLIIFLKEFMNKIFFEHVEKLNVKVTNGSLLYYQKLLSAFNVYEKANDTNSFDLSSTSNDNVNEKTEFVNSNESNSPLQSNNNSSPFESYTNNRIRSSFQAQRNNTLQETGTVKPQAPPSPKSLASLSQQQQQQQQQQSQQQQSQSQNKPPAAKQHHHHRRFSSFHFYRKKSKTKSRLDLSAVASVDRNGSNSEIHINKDHNTHSSSGGNNSHINNSNNNMDGSAEDLSKISSEANTTATTSTNATTIMKSNSINTTDTPMTNASKSPSLASFAMHLNSANTNNTHSNSDSKDTTSDFNNDKINGIVSLEYHRVLSSLFEVVAKLTNYSMFLKYCLHQQENHTNDGNNNKHSKWKHHNKATVQDGNKEKNTQKELSTVGGELAEKLQMTEKVLKFLSKYVIRFILIDVMGLVGDYMRFLSEIFKSGNSDEGGEDIAMSSPAVSSFAQ